MHSDWFNGIEILQGRWQNGEKVGYCYSSGLEKTLFKWDIYVPLVTKGLINHPKNFRRREHIIKLLMMQLSSVSSSFTGLNIFPSTLSAEHPQPSR
jgi:hypothetical protein